MNDSCLVVLLACDHDAIRQNLRALIECSGQRVIVAASAEEAMVRYRACQPDMVIVSHRLASLDGIDFVRRLRNEAAEHPPHITLVVRAGEKNKLCAMASIIIDDFMETPLRPEFVAVQLRVGQRIARLLKENEGYQRKLQHYSTELSCANLRVRELAMTDDLTGLPNRRHAMELMHYEWQMAVQEKTSLGCMSIDLDGLRWINEEQGHERGDVVLKTVAAIMRKYLPAEDVVCRISGAEFLVICPKANLEAVVVRGEKIVRLVASFNIQAKHRPLGLSIGVAERRPSMDGPEELINLAEEAMHHAKGLGGNQVCSGHAPGMKALRRKGAHQGQSDGGRKGKGQMPLWCSPETPLAAAGI